jgi:antitoxin (DNA-binding transcriptional repressor) of toxin-antitoxin stability system
MAIVVPIHEAKTQLTKLIQAVERGERVTITRRGKPVAELGAPTKRKGGVDIDAIHAEMAAKGIEFFVHPDDVEALLAPIDEEDFVTDDPLTDLPPARPKP